MLGLTVQNIFALKFSQKGRLLINRTASLRFSNRQPPLLPSSSAYASGLANIFLFYAWIQVFSSYFPSLSSIYSSFVKLEVDLQKLGTRVHPLPNNYPREGFGKKSRGILGYLCIQVAGVAHNPIQVLTLTPFFLTFSANCSKTN